MAIKPIRTPKRNSSQNFNNLGLLQRDADFQEKKIEEEKLSILEVSLSQQEPELPTILVVNDNYCLLMNLDLSLSSQFTVHTTENGLEAYDAVKSKPKDFFDIILLDIQMPIMDGFEACEKISNYLEGNSLVKMLTINQNMYSNSRSNSS